MPSCAADCTMARKFIVGGNWKMNGSYDLITKMSTLFNNASWSTTTQVVIATPFPYLEKAKYKFEVEGKNQLVHVAAQNCHFENSGALTGEVSIPMLQDLGISWVIIGHSERRALFNETDQVLTKKLTKALNSGLKVIFCIGESLETRMANDTATFLEHQLDSSLKLLPHFDNLCENLVIAYEPIWAIGTGQVASLQQAQEAHVVVRSWLRHNLSEKIGNCMSILYGGSVTASNCSPLAKMPDIDGFLVGGASLKEEFLQICKARD